MALAVTRRGMPTVFGNKKIVFATVTFDSSYPVGGEPYTAGMFGLKTVDFIITSADAAGSATTSYSVVWDRANAKLKLHNSNGAAPAALLETATANQSATTVEVMVIGR